MIFLFLVKLYADDTTLSSTLKTVQSQDCLSDTDINNELINVTDWLKLNKLSLNVNKTKCMIFHNHQRKISNPSILLDNVSVEIVNSFNFLGIEIDKHLNFKCHVDKISLKISRAIGVMNRLKHFLPEHILLNLYNSLVLPHINYGILVWGSNSQRVQILQKRAIRVITRSKYNSHTSPLFKKMNLLTVNDIYKIQCLKFYYKFVNQVLPISL